MLCTRLTVSNPHLGLWRISQPDVAPWSLLHPSLPFPPRRPNWKWSASSHPPPRRGRQLHPLYSLSEKQWWVNCSPAGGPPGGGRSQWIVSELHCSCLIHKGFSTTTPPNLWIAKKRMWGRESFISGSSDAKKSELCRDSCESLGSRQSSDLWGPSSPALTADREPYFYLHLVSSAREVER